jgi:tRNA-dihydrouridine synthase
MLDFTGCDAVMIGRGAIGNPWIFSGLDREGVSVEKVRETLLLHLNSMLDFYGAERGLILFRKHAARYISPYGLTTELRERFLTCETTEEFIELVDSLSPILAESAPALN